MNHAVKPRVVRHCALAVVLSWGCVSVAIGAPPKRAAKWYKPGPYPVGCRTFIFTDDSRVDVSTSRKRQLVTEVWYPAADGARNGPKATFRSFFLDKFDEAVAALKRYTEKIALDEIEKNFAGAVRAVRDAQKRKGKFPLILFSHGNGGIREQSLFLTEHLASHGYIVVACDHTGNASVAPLPEGVVLINAKGSIAAVEDRPRDMSFLIDEMTRQNGDEKSFLYQGIDLDKIGCAGHSFGGITTTIATRDKRIKAIIPLAGVAPAALTFETPVMLMVADQDKTIGKDKSELFLKIYKAWRAPKWLLEFKDAGHFTFSEMHRISPDHGDGVGKGKRFDGTEVVYWDSVDAQQYINAYAVAFFDCILKGESDACGLINGPSLSPRIRVERSEALSK
ncbi:MAG: dienelactone hydrolase family protein [Phycisphaerae bacterium]|nr:dienelactone hydrolase family protein [Phycisphaerae bacterium]